MKVTTKVPEDFRSYKITFVEDLKCAMNFISINYLFCTIILCGKHSYYPHFIGDKSEALGLK